MARFTSHLPSHLLVAMILGGIVPAWGQADVSTAYERPTAQVVSAAGRALAPATAAGRAAAARNLMRERGASDATAAAMVEVSRYTAANGVTHVRLQQQVGGLEVHGAYAKASFNARGELVHLVHAAVPLGGAALRAPSIDAAQALQAAVSQLLPGQAVDARIVARQGDTTSFSPGTLFDRAPTARRVAVAAAAGGLEVGYLVETWTRAGNRLNHTLVGGDGRVLEVENRTANDSYNVYVEDPSKGPQSVIPGPVPGTTTASPAGWLGGGAQSTINISGNNANAYLDVDANNAPDTGGTAVTDGAFTSTVDLFQTPATASNRAVAVQNLFYLNNRVHDILHGYGFVEAEGNFQVDNFGRGGLGGDPVNAEAQDGSGTDNANFSTPVDGSSPRMQMYLWTGNGPTHEVVVGAASYGARDAVFGPALSTSGIAGLVTLAVPADGCTAISTVLTGRIAVVDRGTCNFTDKVRNAQAQGAIGVVVVNNVNGTEIFQMGGTDRRVKIPSVMISQNDGPLLRAQAGASATLRKLSTTPLQIDGDLDADVVFHEYGHGLTWRMIGSMSGPIAGAVGEGASDVVAFMINGDDVIGEYAFSNPNGIRRYPYGAHPLTYKDVTGGEVHNDGEIYAAAMWKLRELFIGAGVPTETLFGYFVDGMKYTPAKPKFEDMRNGMLQSVVANAGPVAHCELIWQAFANRGIGDGAQATIKGKRVTITESFTARSDCSF